MYFPYLRGRQSEMLAIRELIENGLIGDNIIPIIEPIQVNSTLSKTLDSCLKKNRNIAIIMNSPISSDKNIENSIIKDKLKKPNIIKSYLANSNLENEISCNLEYKNLLIINPNKDYEDYFIELFRDEYPLYSLIPYESRKLKRYVTNNKIILEDRFKKKRKNSDYSKAIDEFFSDDHIYFKNENYKGFSDYSIIGSEYSEGGFAPYAIAIHIVYFDKNNELRIRHFVSDSNNDINNPAGKFKEAVKKLNDWMDEEECNSNFKYTYALNKFKEYYSLGKFPGLATIKKLSIMHHIELMNEFIEKELD
ncbi:hypothetical protein JGS6364_00311 [[Clostridium] sordellii]|uniref:sce7725 family protein n=1 Tax=Paraclostridium sordellii TaxID=1505 RepID=UPI0005436736|nr:sce7725 family protein [Paeniclostridium sordellii]CEK29385.1 hypothetical protein JGS6364_00311 [[Clostridium] sordellii] [Paeniclostridium sordellii]